MGALCGLGWDPETGEALLPERDIEVVFDTLITQEDIYKVGQGSRVRGGRGCSQFGPGMSARAGLSPG